MTNRWWRVLCLLCVATSCGGSETGAGGVAPSCEAFAACGGDVVGTWKVADTCVTSSSMPLLPTCPTSTATFDLDVQGTATFVADGTYRNNVSIATTVHATIPASCLTGGISCPIVQAALGTAVASAQCTGDATTGCVCDAHDVQAQTGGGH